MFNNDAAGKIRILAELVAVNLGNTGAGLIDVAGGDRTPGAVCEGRGANTDFPYVVPRLHSPSPVH
jgi:hypothetical protein